jgi:5'-nucleotidase
MAKKIIYIDMDDTICKYSERKAQLLELNPNNHFPQSTYGFFLSLEPIDDSVDTIKALINSDKYEVYILTRPSFKNPMSYLEKRVWIENHFGLDFCEKLILCSDKALLIGDILIDDMLWADFQGWQLHYGHNPIFKDWKEIRAYLLN